MDPNGAAIFPHWKAKAGTATPSGTLWLLVSPQTLAWILPHMEAFLKLRFLGSF